MLPRIINWCIKEVKALEDRKHFDQLVEEALEKSFSGWDFSYLNERMVSEPLPWSYENILRSKFIGSASMLDMGTGGGELLASLQPLPLFSIASEGYKPNVSIARDRLRPLGCSVVMVQPEEELLPFGNNAFDLIVNRHESFSATELFRLLKNGGYFISQQVGGRDNFELNEFLQEEASSIYASWNLKAAQSQLQEVGFELLESQEAFPKTIFKDIGAVVFYLKVIAWQIEDFSVERYYHRLYEMHQVIQQQGQFTAHSHRFFIYAQKPA
jgi:SAM-dependent methyltransferase